MATVNAAMELGKIPEEYLPTFPNFIMKSLRKDALKLWKLYTSGLLKKPLCFWCFFWSTIFISSLKSFCNINTALFFCQNCLLSAAYWPCLEWKKRAVDSFFSFWGHIKNYQREGKRIVISFGQAAATRPIPPGPHQHFWTWDEVHFSFWSRFRQGNIRKNSFFQENQSSFMRAGATDLHLRPILAFRWVK